jgi:hypothetical protein
MSPSVLDLATIISLIALLVSVVFGVVTWRTASRQNALQKQIADIEGARERDRLKQAHSAEVSAAVQHLGRECRLIVGNTGNAVARNLKVLVDGQAALQHRLVPRGEDELTTLGPGASTRYILAVTMGSPRVLDVLLSWEDDSGEQGRWESQLKI